MATSGDRICRSFLVSGASALEPPEKTDSLPNQLAIPEHDAVVSSAPSSREYSIPPWVTWAHRGLLLGGLSFYCFLVYSLVHPLFGTFGFDAVTTVKTLLATCFLGAFVLWLLPLADIPQILYQDRRPRARVRKGRCPQCGYPRPTNDLDVSCPECGSSGQMPPTWELSGRTVVRFLVLLLMAITLGSAFAEWRLLTDELRFKQQASLRNYPQPGDSYTQSRAWPSTYAKMTYTLENGASSDPVLESKRIRRWMRDE